MKRKKKKKLKKRKINNLVAKNCFTFNKPKCYTDRKKELKKGKIKHKSENYE